MSTEEKQENLRNLAEEAALKGLDFFVRNQVRDEASADYGRFPYAYDCEAQKPISLTTNWTTAVGVSSLLIGYEATGNENYIEAAGAACSYIKSLQEFAPEHAGLRGAFHEETPQTPFAHPRDALTAAWALLDYSKTTGDQSGIDRATAFGDWYVETACSEGYPHWTVRFDGQEWLPDWCGSFHSGAAFFMNRLYALTGDEKYLRTMRTILDYYNRYHLDEEGRISVVVDRKTNKPIPEADPDGPAPMNWQVMHHYNDDFGALANLAAWKVTGEAGYRDRATCFLDLMARSQLENGGFGTDDFCVPSAGGAVLIEMEAIKQLGLDRPGYAAARDRAVSFLLSIQKVEPGHLGDGSFFGMTNDYRLSDICTNIRTSAYAIMGLLRYAGKRAGGIYFFDCEPTPKGSVPTGKHGGEGATETAFRPNGGQDENK